MIAPEIEAQVKDRAKVADVVGQFVTLKKAGAGWVGLCPFHDEKTPSFTVTPSRGIYKCFGCGEGGDAVKFLMRHEGLDYPGALQWLANLYSIDTGNPAPRLKPTAPRPVPRPVPITAAPKPDFIPDDIFRATLKGYDKNHFATFLSRALGAELAAELLDRYRVGTSKHKPGAVVFWEVDSRGRVRGGKVMVYNPETGKRRKDMGISSPQAKLGFSENFNHCRCLFGEHLLSAEPAAVVAVVESEKTAIVAAAYLPQFLWLATGGKGNLTDRLVEPLRGRRVVLFPDAGTPDKGTGKTPFALWSEKAAELAAAGFTVKVSDLVERSATAEERATGYDLADYLLRSNLDTFRGAAPITPRPDHAGAQAAQVAPITRPADHSAEHDRTAAPQPAQSAESNPDAFPPGWKLETLTDRHTGQRFELLMTPEGYPAAFDGIETATAPPSNVEANREAAPAADHATDSPELSAAAALNPAVWELVARFGLALEAVEPFPDHAGAAEVEALAAELAALDLPHGPLMIEPGQTITEPAAFIAGHLEMLRGHAGAGIKAPYRERLEAFAQVVRAGAQADHAPPC